MLLQHNHFSAHSSKIVPPLFHETSLHLEVQYQFFLNKITKSASFLKLLVKRHLKWCATLVLRKTSFKTSLKKLLMIWSWSWHVSSIWETGADWDRTISRAKRSLSFPLHTIARARSVHSLSHYIQLRARTQREKRLACEVDLSRAVPDRFSRIIR